MPETQICVGCGKELPYEEFCYYKQHNSSCITCRRKSDTAYRAINRDKINYQQQLRTRHRRANISHLTTCQICHERLESITAHVGKIHHLTSRQYYDHNWEPHKKITVNSYTDQELNDILKSVPKFSDGVHLLIDFVAKKNKISENIVADIHKLYASYNEHDKVTGSRKSIAAAFTYFVIKSSHVLPLTQAKVAKYFYVSDVTIQTVRRKLNTLILSQCYSELCSLSQLNHTQLLHIRRSHTFTV